MTGLIELKLGRRLSLDLRKVLGGTGGRDGCDRWAGPLGRMVGFTCGSNYCSFTLVPVQCLTLIIPRATPGTYC